METSSIRLATEADLAVINQIYNYYVVTSTCTYQLEPETTADRLAWFREHPPEKYPVTVTEFEGEVVGWGSLSKWRPRAAMAPTAEVSFYIRNDLLRRGLGKKLLVDLVRRAREIGFHSVIGGASSEQLASIGLQESLGFQRVANFHQVANKFGQWLDLIYLQLMLDSKKKGNSGNNERL